VHTLKVNVALSCDTGVLLFWPTGIWRGVFVSTVARKRVCEAADCICLSVKEVPKGLLLIRRDNIVQLGVRLV
jgi:hypothetical protein